MAGQKVCEFIGCNICHVESMTTAPQRTPVNGGMFLVPEALGHKIIHLFGDFLLHRIGTGDGIVQVGPEDTAAKLRTAPLWGLRTKSRFMHDLASRHRGEAASRRARFPGIALGSTAAADYASQVALGLGM